MLINCFVLLIYGYIVYHHVYILMDLAIFMAFKAVLQLIER